MKKDSGILMPVLSLPNEYGCGDFGKHAYEFIDKIADIGFSIWQILPLQPLGYGASPYQPYSSKAMDELYISLDKLYEEGLIDKPSSINEESEIINYQKIREYKANYLRQAFYAYEGNDEFWNFTTFDWVKKYATFLTFKKRNEFRSWQEWPDQQKFYPEWHSIDLKEYDEDILYEIFIQFILLKQWQALKNYANSKGILIMGDVPFYVGLDSDDVYNNKTMFELDQQGKPTSVAGVPPDYFSATGQRWGNPIYNWEKMKKDHFHFWIDRIHYASTLYDIIRIDHFRAFETFWKIPATCTTAIEGEWIKAPGYDFFNQLFKEYPAIQIVAEDLGDNMEDVYALRDHFHLKGMTVTQFMFDAGNYTDTSVHTIAYTGTHDNEPIKSWFEHLDEKKKKEVLKGLRKNKAVNKDFNDAMITYTLTRSAETCILPIADLLKLGNEARINTPGLMDPKNWAWKLKDFKALDKESKKITRLLAKADRLKA